MIWIFGIIAIIVVISLAVAVISSDKEAAEQIASAQVKAEWETRMASRVAAYKDYIRREGDKDWQKLSDNELEDMIANAMRGVRRDINKLASLANRSKWGATILIWAAVIFLIFNTPGLDFLMILGIIFGALVVSGVAGYFVSRWVISSQGSKIDRKWESQGWDVDKLIV